jgi:hypothetical protein
MNLDQNAKDAVQCLSDAINSAVEKSFDVRDAIESLRELGYEPVLTLKLEIGLQEIGGGRGRDEFAGDLELRLTDEDVRTLQRMKIRF